MLAILHIAFVLFVCIYAHGPLAYCIKINSFIHINSKQGLNPDVRLSQDVIHVHNQLNTSRSHFEIDGHSINK